MHRYISSNNIQAQREEIVYNIGHTTYISPRSMDTEGEQGGFRASEDKVAHTLYGATRGGVEDVVTKNAMQQVTMKILHACHPFSSVTNVFFLASLSRCNHGLCPCCFGLAFFKVRECNK